MLGTLMMAAVLAMPQQDTTKTRISSDTTHMPPDTTEVIDTTGWLMTDSLALTDTTITIVPGDSFISEIWDYLITGLLGPTPPDTSPPIVVPPPDTLPPVIPPDTLPPIDPTTPPAGPVVVQGPGCTDMADSVSYLCTVQFQPDVMVDSTYWRRGSDGAGTTWFPGDSLQWGYVAFPCTVQSSTMDSRSYRNGIRSHPIVNIPVTHSCSGTPPVTPPDTTPPPPGNGLTVHWDFNDSNDLGVDKSLPTAKQDWTPDQGRNGSGAIYARWWTGMPIGWSPLSLDEQPHSKHYRLTAWVKIVDDDGFPHTMEHEGSSIKLWRFCSDRGCGNRTGTLEYHKRQSPDPVFKQIWDRWLEGAAVGGTNFPPLPVDGQWHKWALEWNFTNLSDLQFDFWLDDVHLRTTHWRGATVDISGPVTISPFVDMYSCGQNANQPGGCQNSVNTGQFFMDDVTYEQLD